MGRGGKVCLVVLAVGLAAGLAIGGSAAACEVCREEKGPVVARGKSLYGVPWTIEAKLSSPEARGPRTVEVNFSISSSGGGFAVGYSMGGIPLPLPRSFGFAANAGSDIDRYPESDLSGVASSRVVKLVVKMDHGKPLTIHPALAPRRLRQRFPWLRELRFFDRFFPDSQKPELVTAFDRSGRVVARHKSFHGSFH